MYHRTCPCGEATVGVDQEYSKAYTDLDGVSQSRFRGSVADCQRLPQSQGPATLPLRTIPYRCSTQGNIRKAQHNLDYNKGNQ